jgi:hypothetical protein
MVVKHGLLYLRKEHSMRVFENRMLRPIFGANRDGNGDWRRLHSEELHSLNRSPNIMRVIKSRRLRWAVVFKLLRGDSTVP